MTPGRELDALVAEKVMGLDAAGAIGAECSLDGKMQRLIYKPYSTSIEAAWEVIDRMRQLGASPEIVLLNYGEEWGVAFKAWKPGNGLVPGAYSHASMPFATCLAALRAVQCIPTGTEDISELREK